MSERRLGVYPGTFDPITYGHLDIIQRGRRLVDHLIIGVSVSAGKDTLLSLDERVAMVNEELTELEGDGHATTEVRPFDTLLVDFATSVGSSIIIRGLRAVSDFEYEFQMTGMNARLDPTVETVFLMATEKHQFIASKLVKEIGRLGGDISSFVSPSVRRHLDHTFALQGTGATPGG
jgi:pantetheine-phosphate adenylyltransferase